MDISKKLIDIFKDDLCKDQREIKVFRDDKNLSRSNMIMRKYNTSMEEYKNEIKVIDYLCAQDIQGIPKILGHGFECGVPYLDIEYFDGIRVYNMLAYLKEIEQTMPNLKECASQIFTQLKEKCLNRQIAIQKGLIAWAKDCNKSVVYPQNKLKNIVFILAEVMQFKDLDYVKLGEELDYIIKKFEKIAIVPFRDATTKNMVIYLPDLYLERYLDDNKDVLSADAKRKEVVINMLKEGKWQSIINAPIVDFDFSSCEHLTTIYDDPIGYNCHEIMWGGFPNLKTLVWGGEPSLNYNEDIAISFIVRYLRFGGRKMCYHIFHPHAYRYRFKYDNENFYFSHLNEVIDYYWKDARKIIPQFMGFVEKVVAFDKSKIIDAIDEFELAYPNCNRKFYLDLFPY